MAATTALCGVSDLAVLLTDTLRALSIEQYENTMRRAMVRESLNLLHDAQRDVEALRRTNAALRDELRTLRERLEREAVAA